MKRCEWPGSDASMQEYHDKEWGTPLHDDQKLFEFMILDAFQAGLNWQIILKKRKGFKKAFHDFNAKKIALYTKKDVNRLLKDSNIIRNRLKIEAAITNAQRFLEIQQEFGSFDKYIWQFVNHKAVYNSWKSMQELPSRSQESDAMSQALKQRGFKFVGSTICYAFMQAAGLVNDHATYCFRHKELRDAGKNSKDDNRKRF